VANIGKNLGNRRLFFGRAASVASFHWMLAGFSDAPSNDGGFPTGLPYRPFSHWSYPQPNRANPRFPAATDSQQEALGSLNLSFLCFCHLVGLFSSTTELCKVPSGVVLNDGYGINLLAF